MNNAPEPNARAAVDLLPAALGEYEVRGVLGKGGFSVVYDAWDVFLKRPVAIKEYMPSAIATCLPTGVIMPKSPKDAETFKAGLTSFVSEAQLLAQFTHPALVHVYRVWEQNHTAYMAMQYCVGRTLTQISQSDPARVKDEGWLKATFTPILDVLEMLHAQNCYHRDVSPDNILILQGGGPMLLDFGSARHIVGGMTESLTVVLNPGFAPVEQYADADDPNFQQGPWTDVYGVGAVLYFLLTGKPPIASVARLVKDPVVKLADSTEFPGVPRSFREAIDRALAVAPDQRIQSVAQLRQALRLPNYKPEGHFGNLSGASFSAVAQQDSRATVSLERGSSAGAPFPPVLQPAKRSTSAWDALIESGQQANSGAIPYSDHTSDSAETVPYSPVSQPEEQGGAWDAPVEDDQAIDPFGSAEGSVDEILPPALQSGEEQGGSVLNTPIEVAQAAPEEDPPSDQADDDDADDDSEARAADDASPVFTGVPASSSPNSGQSVRAVAAQVLQRSAAAAVGATQAIGRQPPWFRNIVLGVIGLVVVAAVAVGLLHNNNQPVAPIDQDQGIPADHDAAPVTDVIEPPPQPVEPSAADNPASGATAVVAVPQVVADPASAAQVTAQPDENPSVATPSVVEPQRPPVPKVATPPVVNRPPSVASASAPDNAPFVRLFIKPWGQVVVDGRSEGISPPLTRLPLSPGPHVITITNGNLPPVTLKVTVPEEGNIIVAHEFE